MRSMTLPSPGSWPDFQYQNDLLSGPSFSPSRELLVTARYVGHSCTLGAMVPYLLLLWFIGRPVGCFPLLEAFMAHSGALKACPQKGTFQVSSNWALCLKCMVSIAIGIYLWELGRQGQ